MTEWIDEPGDRASSIRVDKWLWFARFFKSRPIASRLCASSRIRINKRLAGKASTQIRIGDVLTFPQGNRIRVVRVVQLGTRRGPAPEAATLYEDLSPAHDCGGAGFAARRETGGRPTKAARRQIDRLRPQPGEV